MTGAAWSVVPARLIRDPRLKAGAKATAAALGLYTDADGVCWPARATLAADLGVSVDTVDRGLAALVEAGWLEVLPRQTAEGDRDSNLYLWRLDLAVAEVVGRLEGEGGVAANLRLPGRTDAPTGGRTDAALTKPVGTDTTTGREEFSPRVDALWETLAGAGVPDLEQLRADLRLRVRSAGRWEAMCSALLLGLEGIGVEGGRGLAPEDLAVGIRDALANHDHPSVRDVLVCAAHAAPPARPARLAAGAGRSDLGADVVDHPLWPTFESWLVLFGKPEGGVAAGFEQWRRTFEEHEPGDVRAALDLLGETWDGRYRPRFSDLKREVRDFVRRRGGPLPPAPAPEPDAPPERTHCSSCQGAYYDAPYLTSTGERRMTPRCPCSPLPGHLRAEAAG